MISVDVSQFVLTNVIDTCAIWNVLSSRTLYHAARRAKCTFSLTGFVEYECLYKRRSRARSADEQLVARLRTAMASGEIRAYALAVEDLQEVEVLQNRRRVSKGELSAMVFAKRTGQAFLTDDRGARRLGTEALPKGHTQTTPHLLGWLLFGDYLTDGAKQDVIREHSALEGTLSPHLEEIYFEAMRCKLLRGPT